MATSPGDPLSNHVGSWIAEVSRRFPDGFTSLILSCPSAAAALRFAESVSFLRVEQNELIGPPNGAATLLPGAEGTCTLLIAGDFTSPEIAEVVAAAENAGIPCVPTASGERAQANLAAAVGIQAPEVLPVEEPDDSAVVIQVAKAVEKLMHRWRWEPWVSRVSISAISVGNEMESELRRADPGGNFNQVINGVFAAWNLWKNMRAQIGRPPHLPKANLRGQQLTGADLRNANLFGADLCESIAYYPDLRDAKLIRAYLQACQWFKPTLKGCCLQEANLIEAKLKHVILEGNWTGATLARAELHVVDVIDPILTGVDFTDCFVTGKVGKLKRFLTEQQREQIKTSRCFIATACCPEVDPWEVAVLRRFRDERLARRRLGRALIALYEAVGPVLAHKIEPQSWLQRAVRATLVTPLARLIQAVVRQ